MIKNYFILVIGFMTIGTFSIPCCVITGMCSLLISLFLSLFIGQEWLQHESSLVISWLVFCFTVPALILLYEQRDKKSIDI